MSPPQHHQIQVPQKTHTVIEHTQHPVAHKELIVNLQEEVNFLAKQNTRLKAALMNSSGVGLVPAF